MVFEYRGRRELFGFENNKKYFKKHIGLLLNFNDQGKLF